MENSQSIIRTFVNGSAVNLKIDMELLNSLKNESNAGLFINGSELLKHLASKQTTDNDTKDISEYLQVKLARYDSKQQTPDIIEITQVYISIANSFIENMAGEKKEKWASQIKQLSQLVAETR